MCHFRKLWWKRAITVDIRFIGSHKKRISVSQIGLCNWAAATESVELSLCCVLVRQKQKIPVGSSHCEYVRVSCYIYEFFPKIFVKKFTLILQNI